VKKRGAMQQYMAQFKMLFNRENGRHMDTNDGKEVLKVYCCFLLPASCCPLRPKLLIFVVYRHIRAR
jgi:hypothetical protein